MSESNNIAGKVIIITGASSGLGASAARYLSSLGGVLVLAARRKDKIDSLAQEIVLNGHQAIAIQTDVTDVDQVNLLIKTAMETYGKIDVLINNAGIMPNSPLELGKIEDWNRAIDINIRGVLYGISAVLPYMKEQKFGQIISVASVAGHKVVPGSAVYSATKTAVRVISEGLRQEVKAYNIRTGVISPGAVDTDLPASITVPEISDKVKQNYAKYAIPDSSFARAAAFIISQPQEVDVNEVLFRPTVQDL